MRTCDINHVILLVAMIFSSVRGAIANVVLIKTAEMNPFMYILWFVVPIGAVAVGSGPLAAR